MNVKEAIQRLRAAQNDVNSQLGAELAKQANNMAALIKNRVLQKQQRADGSSWGGYSQKKIPAYLYYNTALRVRKGLNEIKQLSKKGEGLSYAGFRKLIGKTNANKDFELTGQMWMDFGIIKTSRDTVRLGFKTQRSIEVAKANTKREGYSIVDISESERQILSRNMSKWLNNIFIRKLQ